MFYKAVGLMSGTSLDGLDMAYCEFEEKKGEWKYEILQAETVEYTDDLRKRIISMETASGEELSRFDMELGHFFGMQAEGFIRRHKLTPELVSSHGQTIFHRPSASYTTQIGNLAAICSHVRTKTVGDFRTLDLALGGQGAPLVPIGDLLLFKDYENCLNIGGFANITHKDKGGIRAYDICPANIVLNRLSRRKGMPFDQDGRLAKSGKIDDTLLEKLNALPYYKEKHSKSLGSEWVKANIDPLLAESGLSTEDLLATYTAHAAEQIAKNICGRTIVSGGGAYNEYLLSSIRKNCGYEITTAEKKITDYKEAMIFAFLGVLRDCNRVNCLSSVTGARQSSCCGTVIQWIETKRT